MPERERILEFRIREQGGPGGRLVLECADGLDRQRIVISDYRGPELPASLRDPLFEPGEEAGVWRLIAAEGNYLFQARSIDRIDERPGLFLPLHRPFALSGTDRAAVRILLWLLRLPGGARLLRRWHAGRGG